MVRSWGKKCGRLPFEKQIGPRSTTKPGRAENPDVLLGRTRPTSAAAVAPFPACPRTAALRLALSPSLLRVLSFTFVLQRAHLARVNRPSWLHQLAVLSIGWAGWFASFSFTSLPYVNRHSTTVNLFWLLTFDHFFFHWQIFPNPDLHTHHPPSYYNDLNLSLAY
jgi:hypothetical protein